MSEEKGKSISLTGVLSGTLALVLGVLCFVGFVGAGMVIDYIDQRIEEDCDTATGQVVQITGADEGKCDEGSTIRDILVAIRTPILLLGVVFCLLAANISYQK